MRVAKIKIKGLTPYSQSKPIQSEKKKNESHDEFDQRIWREHIHQDPEGQVVIPAVAIGPALAVTASYLGKSGQLSKKGQATWAENIRCGLAVASSPQIGKRADEARPERIYAHANGKRGPGTRVWRTFPIFDDWSATLVIHILDDTIPEEIFMRVVEACGIVNGFGRYRPQNGGDLGRYVVESYEVN